MLPLWGIDLGGTKIEGVLLESRENPRVLTRLRVPTEADKGYEHVIAQIVKLIEVMTAEVGMRPSQIGMATPGVLDPASQTMKNCNIDAINGNYFKQDLEKILNTSFVLANDANCFAIAEANMGAAFQKMPNAEVVFGVIMGTGVGGGVVVNQKVIGGRHGIGGEWGHNFLDASGSGCYCGKSGCVESILSGPSLQRHYTDLTGRFLTMQAIYEAHLRGNDREATATIQRLIHFFGKAISTVINIIDPDVIVIGGGVGNIDVLYTEGREEVRKYIFNQRRLDTLFLKPALGDSAGVFGAALL
jgi:fructokinase